MLSILKSDKAENFEKLYFDNFSMLCKSVYRFVKDEDITKDIVQEVFLRLWQRYDEIKLAGSPKSYLHKACINQALNYLKEKERRVNREETFGKSISISDQKSNRPDVKYEASEVSRNIQQEIDDLPKMCKSAFLLSRHEGKSYKEIAELMKISVNTVEKHIGKALKILRNSLKKD